MAAAGSMLFAEGDYAALLAKAKDYEAKKQYVHALGTYWDAMEAAPEKTGEALDAYDKLGAVIRAGNPGYGEFDDFDIYDGWLALCKEYERYWTECCPNAFTFSIRKGELDMKTRTATYYVDIKVDESCKYKDIAGNIMTGLKSKWTKDWEGIPERWPAASVYGSEDKNFNKDGTALVKVPIIPLGNNKWAYTVMPAALFSLGCSISGRRFIPEHSSLYDVKFNITDEAGTVLLTSGRKLMGSKGGYEFKGVPQSTMKIIDSGKARIVPVGLYLEYGKLAEKWQEDSRDWLKPLPELAIEIRADNFNLPGVPAGDVNATKPVIVATAKSVAVDGILVRTTEVTQAEYEAVTGSNPACYKDYRRPVEQVSWYDAIRFCNLLSVRDGLTPCYSVKGSTNVDTWTDYSADDVEWNKAANGWRLPTEEEWVKAADDGHEYSGSDDIDDVAWYSGNSDSETHDVADKKANANGLYDMSGNVEEWCWDFYNDSFFYRDPSDRVYRGGSCDSHADDCAVSVRGHYFPGDRSSDLGFRIVRSSSAK